MRRLILFWLLGFWVSGCGEPEHAELVRDEPSEQFTISDEDFTLLKAQVLSVSCTGCHKQMNDKDYVLRNANKIVESILSDEMPQDAPPLSAELKAMVQVILGGS